MFLGGDIDQYQRQCARADRTVALVALSLLDDTAVVTVPEAVTALIDGPDGATEEDFLGYSRRPALHSTIQRGLAQLIAEQVVRAIDGAHFEQQRNVRRSLLAAFNRP